MPIMDGFQATIEIKQILDKILIVGLTAYTNESFKIKCLDSGMDYVLTKPINFNELREILEELRLTDYT